MATFFAAAGLGLRIYGAHQNRSYRAVSGQDRAVFAWDTALTDCFPVAAKPFEGDMHGGFNEDKNTVGIVVFDHKGKTLIAVALNNDQKILVVNLNGKIVQEMNKPEGHEFLFEEANEYYSKYKGKDTPKVFSCTDVTYMNGKLYVVTGYCPGDFVLTMEEKKGKWHWGKIAWGGRGDKPGQFKTAHGVYAHEGSIYVANREGNYAIDYLEAYAEDHVISTIIPGDLGIPVLRHCHVKLLPNECHVDDIKIKNTGINNYKPETSSSLQEPNPDPPQKSYSRSGRVLLAPKKLEGYEIELSDEDISASSYSRSGRVLLAPKKLEGYERELSDDYISASSYSRSGRVLLAPKKLEGYEIELSDGDISASSRRKRATPCLDEDSSQGKQEESALPGDHSLAEELCDSDSKPTKKRKGWTEKRIESHQALWRKRLGSRSSVDTCGIKYRYVFKTSSKQPRYYARVAHRGEKYQVPGTFSTPYLAAMVADAKAVELGQAPSNLNFPVNYEALKKEIAMKGGKAEPGEVEGGSLIPTPEYTGGGNTYVNPVRSSSGYRGVHKSGTCWTVQLEHRGSVYNLGRFKNPVEAALEYDRKSIDLGRDQAYLNFPDSIAKATT
eukprot:UC4_evm1s1289